MRIALVQIFYYEYIGLMYLSAVLKQHGHEVEVFIPTAGNERLVRDVMEYAPDVVGFSIMTGSEDWALDITQQLKHQGDFYIVFGGPHPTFFPEIVEQPGVDAVCLGEAEGSLASIVQALEKGEVPRHIPSAWCKQGDEIIKNDMDRLVEDLDALPFPDRSLYRDTYPNLGLGKE